ncbi:YfiR family protein [Saccharicrinis fermentans]|uniref:YfiR family protein n=1 Tax=Saccharicrinis fermentans DSM 9555 = JCM 21142 TaxID=869213 RepID=W7Y726_9BACT|nr:YfiR family protein [Saccharicrinis fermentans]GAF03463.1 hypothetical protein JCM21142_52139 [Saccharicrinis fermentans DSM 9555 = JCM 21142]
MKVKNLSVLLAFVFVFNFVDAQVRIQKVEASFIANFMRYIKWPGQESIKTMKVGVFGTNQAIYDELNITINGKNVGMATIAVVEVQSAEEMKDCHIVFVSREKLFKAKKELEALGANSVMTITEEQNYMPKFAMVNFKVVNSKLTFQLNQELAKQKKIQVSSKLVQMASS